MAAASVMKRLLLLITLPFWLFDALATRIVAPPTDEALSREDAGRLRDLELEAKVDTPPWPMG